jgi:magnesium-transporting ATPase (P-type)
MCFDKTGTLTSDGMEVMGVRVVSRLLGAPLSSIPLNAASNNVLSGGYGDDWDQGGTSVDGMRMPTLNARDRSFPTEPARLPVGSSSIARDAGHGGLSESPGSDTSDYSGSPMMGGAGSVTATPPLPLPPNLRTATPPSPQLGPSEEKGSALSSPAKRGNWRSMSFSQHFAPLTIDTKSMGPEILAAMATCHSLAALDGNLIGDPLEVKMFEAAGAELRDKATGQFMSVCRWKDPNGGIADAGISHQFEFQSALQRMAVIAHLLPSSSGASGTTHLPASLATGNVPLQRRGPSTRAGGPATAAPPATTGTGLSSRAIASTMAPLGDDHGATGDVSSLLAPSMSYSTGVPSARAIHAYVKGSPEMIISLSLPHTIPPDYAKVLSVYTRRGFRVIAVAFKPLAAIPDIPKDLLRGEVLLHHIIHFNPTNPSCCLTVINDGG